MRSPSPAARARRRGPPRSAAARGGPVGDRRPSAGQAGPAAGADTSSSSHQVRTQEQQQSAGADTRAAAAGPARVRTREQQSRAPSQIRVRRGHERSSRRVPRPRFGRVDVRWEAAGACPSRRVARSAGSRPSSLASRLSGRSMPGCVRVEGRGAGFGGGGMGDGVNGTGPCPGADLWARRRLTRHV